MNYDPRCEDWWNASDDTTRRSFVDAFMKGYASSGMWNLRYNLLNILTRERLTAAWRENVSPASYR